MDFRPLKAKDLTTYDELPAYIYKKLVGNVIAWAAFEGTDAAPLGIVIVSADPIEKNRAFLDYIHVREDKRRRGIGSEIIKNVEVQLMNYRISALYVKVITNESECRGIYDFLIKNAYIPTAFNGKLLEYKISQIKTEEFLDSFSQSIQKKLRIESFDKIGPVAKKKILATCWENNISVTEQLLSSEYTMIMNKQEPGGFLAVQKIDDSMLYVWDSYLGNSKTRDITFLLMLASTIEKSLKDKGLKHEASLVISLFDQTLITGLEKLIGEAQSKKSQQEFNKLLRR